MIQRKKVFSKCQTLNIEQFFVSTFALSFEPAHADPVFIQLNHETFFLNYSKITDQMVCAENPGTDSCQGDSGGKKNHKQNHHCKQCQFLNIIFKVLYSRSPNQDLS